MGALAHSLIAQGEKKNGTKRVLLRKTLDHPRQSLYIVPRCCDFLTSNPQIDEVSTASSLGNCRNFRKKTLFGAFLHKVVDVMDSDPHSDDYS